MQQVYILIYCLAIFASTITAIICRKNKELDPLRFYLIINVINFILMFLIPNSNQGKEIYFMKFNLFTMIDFTVIYYYFSRRLTSKSVRLFLLLCYLTVCLIGVYFCFIRIPEGYKQLNAVFYGIQNLFITIPCIVYLYLLFQSDDDGNLKTNPHFIATCGILFFYATTFPFYITYNSLMTVTPHMNLILNTINTILIALMSATLVKAFLCPYPVVK